MILFFTGWVYQEMQYNAFFQAYVNSLLPLIATIISIALGITGGAIASILAKRYRKTREKQMTIPSRHTTRPDRTTKTHTLTSKPKPKTTTLTPRRPPPTTPKSARVLPTVQIPKFILEPQKPDAREKTPAKTETTPDKPHSRDQANQRTPR